MNCVTDLIVQEAITREDPHIMGVSTIVDVEDEENAEGTSNVDHKSATPYTIHTAVLPKPSLINANVNSSINAMWKLFNRKIPIPMTMIILMKLYPVMIMKAADLLFRYLVNQMSQLLSGQTTPNS